MAISYVEEKAKAEYQEWVERQFNAWDGSNIYLVKLVKENMNDPKSFEHIETRYKYPGDGLDLYTEFREKCFWRFSYIMIISN